MKKHAQVIFPFFSLLYVLMLALPSSAQRIRFTDTSNKWFHTYADWSQGPQLPPYWYAAGSAYGQDTTISGIRYHQLRTWSPVNTSILAVREDTLVRKVFFRFTTAATGDTFEHVLYDYNLRSGDTLKIDFGTTHIGHVVSVVDSVQMGGAFYKRWMVTSYGTFMQQFYIIEGIGTNWNPVSVLGGTGFESAFQLRCFSNQNGQPRCLPATQLFYSTPIPFFARQPIPVRYFDNDSSCLIEYLPRVGVSGVQPDPKPLIVPNPGGRDAMMLTPSSMGAYRLTISDIAGRIIAMREQTSNEPMNVGQLLHIPGTYFYSMQRLANGQRIAGRFTFQ